jgi:hypothetical protein
MQVCLTSVLNPLATPSLWLTGIWLRPYACATVHQYQASLIQPNAFCGVGQADGIEAATGADGIIF